VKDEENAKTAEVLPTLSGGEAREILRHLADRSPAIAREIRDLSMQALPAVDPLEVAEALRDDLESLAVEDVWEAAGETRYGYRDPSDLAFEMFEEVVGEYREQAGTYQQRARGADARSYCLGIIKGLYDFAGESSTPFKDYVEDAPGQFFELLVSDWSRVKGPGTTADEISDFVAEHCPGWIWRVRRSTH
jgi:DNA-binding transcriptional ArsR family regulator